MVEEFNIDTDLVRIPHHDLEEKSALVWIMKKVLATHMLVPVSFIYLSLVLYLHIR